MLNEEIPVTNDLELCSFVDVIVTTDTETSEQLYGRFEECSLTSGYNTTICVYNCQCQMAAQCTRIHVTVMNNNFTLCGIDVVATL